MKQTAGERLIEGANQALDLAKRSWPQDRDHENGNYSCICVTCGATFIGHKRRMTCRVCYDAAVENHEAR